VPAGGAQPIAMTPGIPMSRQLGHKAIAMLAARILLVLAMLGFPAVFAPLLVHAGCRFTGRLRTACAAIICLIPLTAPWLLVGYASRLTLWLVTIAGGIVMLKAIDWLSRPRLAHDLIRVWLVLTFWPALQIEDVAVPLSGLAERMRLVLRRFAAGATGLAAGLALAASGQHLGISDQSVLLGSTWKTIEIYLLAGGSNHLLVGTFAAAGYRIQDGFRYPILAHSVLDFWSRYNVWIHRWLKQHIFLPIGLRRRNPVLGILAVFAVSGLLHEYLFLPIDRTVLGWQLAFFLVHGVGALAGVGLGRTFERISGRRPPRPLAIAATVAFVLLTAPLFIHCLDRVFDLHRNLGAWVLRTPDLLRPILKPDLAPIRENASKGETPEVFRRMGANAAACILEEASAFFGPSGPSMDRESRMAALLALPNLSPRLRCGGIAFTR
jgi:MBOAT, membrane-bound O-acyltransferase family